MFSYSLEGLEIAGDLPLDREIEENATTARSAVYQVFARMFHVPDEAGHRTAVEGKWPELLRDAAQLLAFEFDFGEGRLDGSVTAEQYRAEYQRLFDAADPVAPIIAGFYGADRTRQTEEVVRFFEYFGLKISKEAARPPDHLATELEFMQYLAFKEAASASPRLAGSFRRAQEDFLARQLSTWLPEFARRVAAGESQPIWTWAAHKLVEFIEADVRYLKG